MGRNPSEWTVWRTSREREGKVVIISYCESLVGEWSKRSLENRRDVLRLLS